MIFLLFTTKIRYIFIICTLIKDWRTTYKMVIELDLKFLCEKSEHNWTIGSFVRGKRQKNVRRFLPLRINHPLMLNIYGKLTITRFFRSMCACVRERFYKSLFCFCIWPIFQNIFISSILYLYFLFRFSSGFLQYILETLPLVLI